MVEATAARLSNSSRARRVGAELDDLIQEGLIFVWQTLERGHRVSGDMVQNRMLDWMRLMARQTGYDLPSCDPKAEDDSLDPCPQHIPYERILPLDDFRVVREG